MSHFLFDLPVAPPDQRLRYGPNDWQFADLRLPAGRGPHPVAIMIHGGFWKHKYTTDHIAGASSALTRLGFATWTVEYHRVGKENGWPCTFQDVGAAADHLCRFASEFHLDLKRVIAVGHSSGGHLALWLAGRHKLPATSEIASLNPLQLSGVVSLAGVTDLRMAFEMRLGDDHQAVQRLMGGSPSEFEDRYRAASPIELLPFSTPHLLIHGTDDPDVPFIFSRRYCKTAQRLGDVAHLIRLDGCGHFELIDPRRYEWLVIRSAILELIE